MDSILNKLGYSLYDSLEEDDEDNFLDELPLELIENSIRTQFEEPLEYRKKDYIKDFIKKYEICKQNELEEDLQEMESVHYEFVNFMRDIFDEFLGIEIEEIENMNDDTANDIIHHTYRYFIKCIKKNFSNIVCNEIDEHSEDFIADYIDDKKDITYHTFKDEVTDPHDIIILGNLNTIVDDILQKVLDTYTIEDFFKMSDSDEVNLDKEYVEGKYAEYKINGNFIPKYVAMVDGDFKIEIEAKLRNHILKKYPNSVKKFINQKEEDLDTEEKN